MKRDANTKKLQRCAELCVARGYGLAYSLVGKREDAEDLVQECLLIASRKVDEVPRRPWPWLAATITNLARNHRRKETRRGPKATFDESQHAFTGKQDASALEDAIRLEMQEKLRREMERLAPSERQALALVYLAGLSLREAAKQAERPLSSFKRDRDNALAKLAAGIDLPQKALLSALPLLALSAPSAGLIASLSATSSTAATSSTITLATTTIIGSLIMKKTIAALLLLVLLLLGGYGAWHAIENHDDQSGQDSLANHLASDQSENREGGANKLADAGSSARRSRPSGSKKDSAPAKSQSAQEAKETGDAKTEQADPLPRKGEAAPIAVPQETVEDGPYKIWVGVFRPDAIDLTKSVNLDGIAVAKARITWFNTKDQALEINTNVMGYATVPKGFDFHLIDTFEVHTIGRETQTVEREAVATQRVFLEAIPKGEDFSIRITMPDGKPYRRGSASVRIIRDGEPLTSRMRDLDQEGLGKFNFHPPVKEGDELRGLLHYGGGDKSRYLMRTGSIFVQDPKSELHWRVAPDLRVQGRFVDSYGTPLVGAKTAVHFSTYKKGLLQLSASAETFESDAEGRFDLQLPKGVGLRLIGTWKSKDAGQANPRYALLDQTWEFERTQSVLNLGDVVMEEAAAIRVQAMLDGKPMVKARFGYKHFHFSKQLFATDKDGRIEEIRISKKALKESGKPLVIRIWNEEGEIEWTDITERVLLGDLITLHATRTSKGRLELRIGKAANGATGSPRCAIWSLAGEGETISAMKHYTLYINKEDGRFGSTELPAGDYRAMVISNSTKGMHYSRTFAFSISAGALSSHKVNVELPAQVSFDVAPKYRKGFESSIIYAEGSLKNPWLPTWRAQDNPAAGSNQHTLFWDAEADLQIAYRGSDHLESLKIPIAKLAPGQKLELDLSKEIAGLVERANKPKPE